MFGRLKDFRRVAARYDKLTQDYASILATATMIVYWTLLNLSPKDPVSWQINWNTDHI